MHVVYVACEFGFYSLPGPLSAAGSGAAGVLRQELDHLAASLGPAMLQGDTEMVGEVLDCLEVAGSDAVGRQGLALVSRARLWLAQQQKADGSWGEDDHDLIHRVYVACLGLLARGRREPASHGATSFKPIDVARHWRMVEEHGLGARLLSTDAAADTQRKQHQPGGEL